MGWEVSLFTSQPLLKFTVFPLKTAPFKEKKQSHLKHRGIIQVLDLQPKKQLLTLNDRLFIKHSCRNVWGQTACREWCNLTSAEMKIQSCRRFTWGHYFTSLEKQQGMCVKTTTKEIQRLGKGILRHLANVPEQELLKMSQQAEIHRQGNVLVFL